MRTDRITLVTGDPRSGTSLMMQTLDLLGVPVAGEKYPQKGRLAEGTPDQQRRLERTRVMNPRGFYEVPGVVVRGTSDRERFAGQALKVVSPGAWPHAGAGTPPEIVDKYILCLRDPTSVGQSQTHLEMPVQVSGDGEWQPPAQKPSPVRFLLENGGLAQWLFENDEPRGRVLVVDYDDFLDHPDRTLARVIAHLEIEPTPDQIDAARSNVDPALRRSPGEFTGWPEALRLDGEAAQAVYESLRELSPELWLTAWGRLESRREFHRRERTRWYDPAIGILATAGLFRILQTDAEKRRVLVEGAGRVAGFRRQLQQGLHPQCTVGFRAAEETYTIERPADFGDLTRPLVIYRGETMTWERAFAWHQQLWNARQADLLPKLERQRLARRVRNHGSGA